MTRITDKFLHRSQDKIKFIHPIPFHNEKLKTANAQDKRMNNMVEDTACTNYHIFSAVNLLSCQTKCRSQDNSDAMHAIKRSTFLPKCGQSSFNAVSHGRIFIQGV
jgi:hypothetical protein